MMRPARSSRRVSRSVTSLADSRTKRRRSGWFGRQLFERPPGRLKRRVEVRDAALGLPGASGVGGPETADDAAQRLALLGSEDVEELIEIDRRRRVLRVDGAAVRDRLVGAWSEAQVDVAVGDAGEGRRANDALGALAQGRVLVVDADAQLGLAVVGQGDVLGRFRPGFRIPGRGCP